MSQTAKRDFSAQAATWDDNPTRVELADAIVGAIVGRLRLDGTQEVFDYGAGTGLVTLGLYPHVRTIVAADSAKGMLDVLGQKCTEVGLNRVETLLLDLEHEAPPGRRFDLVVSTMTLHHIADAQRLVRVLSEMLRPGGFLAIADLDLDGGQFHTDSTGVMHEGFDRSEVAALFASSGLTEIAIQTVHTVTKPALNGQLRDFTVFLATGKKPVQA